jgi:hypothetical protein
MFWIRVHGCNEEYQVRSMAIKLMQDRRCARAQLTRFKRKDPRMSDEIAAANKALLRMKQTHSSRLRALFEGEVIAPNDAGYDEARTVFYGGSTAARR